MGLLLHEFDVLIFAFLFYNLRQTVGNTKNMNGLSDDNFTDKYPFLILIYYLILSVSSKFIVYTISNFYVALLLCLVGLYGIYFKFHRKSIEKDPKHKADYILFWIISTIMFCLSIVILKYIIYISTHF